MDVILIENVPNLGAVGELVKVKAGYARNFLLPQKMAVLATPGNAKQFEHQKRMVSQRMDKMRTEAQGLKARVEAFKCEIARQVGEEDKLFGSVSSRDIADALEEGGIEIDRRTIALEAPIKTTGVHEVSIRLFKDVTATLKVWVVGKE